MKGVLFCFVCFSGKYITIQTIVIIGDIDNTLTQSVDQLPQLPSACLFKNVKKYQ